MLSQSLYLSLASILVNHSFEGPDFQVRSLAQAECAICFGKDLANIQPPPAITGEWFGIGRNFSNPILPTRCQLGPLVPLLCRLFLPTAAGLDGVIPFTGNEDYPEDL